MNHPFETTENGHYRVVQPSEGLAPDELTVEVGGREFHLSDYAGKDIKSRVRPDVLVYRELEVLD